MQPDDGLLDEGEAHVPATLAYDTDDALELAYLGRRFATGTRPPVVYREGSQLASGSGPQLASGRGPQLANGSSPHLAAGTGPFVPSPREPVPPASHRAPARPTSDDDFEFDLSADAQPGA